MDYYVENPGQAKPIDLGVGDVVELQDGSAVIVDGGLPWGVAVWFPERLTVAELSAAAQESEVGQCSMGMMGFSHARQTIHPQDVRRVLFRDCGGSVLEVLTYAVTSLRLAARRAELEAKVKDLPDLTPEQLAQMARVIDLQLHLAALRPELDKLPPPLSPLARFGFSQWGWTWNWGGVAPGLVDTFTIQMESEKP